VTRSRRSLSIAAVAFLASLSLAYASVAVSQQTIDLVVARRLVPRWDLATHLGHGWLDYHLLVTGRIPQLLWDLWLQGYWPPLLSIYQIPFYLLLGGGLRAGLASALFAFAMTGAAGVALLWRQWREHSVLSAALFLALLISSPYLLAYASVTMTEMFGAMVQLVVLYCYAGYRRHPDPRSARRFAIALTLSFFTKYNYFLLLGVPLAIHEWLDRTGGWPLARRASNLAFWLRRALASPAVALAIVYAIAMLIVVRTGGFEFHLLGQRISVHSIGNSGHVVLALVLARLWYLHHRGRLDWRRITGIDPLVRPLLLWFVVPVAVWLASPYPNHLRDFANLVINLPLERTTGVTGLWTYVGAMRTAYFSREWVLALVVAALAVAIVRYRAQPVMMRCVLVTTVVQFAALAFHHTRSPRFLLPTVVLLCLAAASEIGRWFAAPRLRPAALLLAVVVLTAGVSATRRAVAAEPFRSIAFENYADSPALRAALDSIRGELTANDRLAVIGHSNDLSPALMRWELGPPSGVACFPFQIGGAAKQDLALATRVLLIEGSAPFMDLPEYYERQRGAVLDAVARGDLAPHRDIPLPDLQLLLRLFTRTTPPPRTADCE
jgi:hypothetical protein